MIRESFQLLMWKQCVSCVVVPESLSQVTGLKQSVTFREVASFAARGGREGFSSARRAVPRRGLDRNETV